jgi:hypothetical protein
MGRSRIFGDEASKEVIVQTVANRRLSVQKASANPTINTSLEMI